MCKSNTYKGFIIYHNKKGDKFDCPYLSIVNQRINKSDGHKVHVHIQASEKTAKLIIDCGLDIIHKGFTCRTRDRVIKNKAMRLIGLDIRSR